MTKPELNKAAARLPDKSIFDVITTEDWTIVRDSADIKLHNAIGDLGYDPYEDVPFNIQWAAVTGFEGAMEALQDLGYVLVKIT